MLKKIASFLLSIILVVLTCSVVSYAYEPNNTDTLSYVEKKSELENSVQSEISKYQEKIIDKAQEELDLEKKLDSGFLLPILKNGDTVSDELYQKYSNGTYCAKVFALYALNQGWSYEAVVGALAFMWAEGLGTNGTFTYEGCWSVAGPSGIVYDKTLNNEAWKNWVNSSNCASQMISHTNWYSSAHYAFGCGYCAESNVWDGGRKTLDLCDKYFDAASELGVAWQDINFQTQRAIDFLTSSISQSDSDWRDPTTFSGTAEEYCARIFATNGYPAFSVWYDNGQLQTHLDKVSEVRPIVDSVMNKTAEVFKDIR